ncbi:MAG: hybrid sensor histidine kinase/response regulator [Ignavibacteria bacterium]|nr:hybrid sensor histidine kinase/response regulator [Ignavibacteria bacterium]
MSEISQHNQLVLIVDDLPQNIEVLGNILSNRGVKIAIALNGQQAINIATKKKPDLILLDVAMPEMDGFEVCKILKENPETREIPIIFLTAKTETDDIVKGFEIGAVDYITKPFKTAELLARVRTHLELKRSRDLITQQIAQLEKLIEDKDKFISVISHDLRGPFTGFLGLTKFLSENIDSFTQEEIVEISKELHNSLLRQYQLLENLLEWSKIQIGKVKVKKEKIDVSEIVKNKIELFQTAAKSKNIELITKIPQNTYAFADPIMIGSVIHNLISNAIKYTNEGGNVTIDILYKENYLEITVSDSGIGISDENIKKLFHPEYSFSTPGTKMEKGTGLGLVIAKEMIELNDGKITVESKENVGTTFHLFLPVKT